MDKLEKVLLVVLVVTTLLGVYWGFANPEYFTHRYMMEDGIIEYATVVLLIASCGLTGIRWVRYRRDNSFRFSLISMVVVMLFFFIAGEEISWGQRIFELETTDYFKEHNEQKEINLHNLVVGDVKVNKLLFGVLLTTAILIYLAIVPVLHHKVKSIRNLLDSWYIPVPRIRHSVAYLVLLLTISIIPAGRKWELLEFGSALIFFLILWAPFNEYLYGYRNINTKTF